MVKKILLLIFTIILFATNASSQYFQLSDSAKVSLLTNNPWEEEVYALFGHTAIRINDPLNKIDVAFNYGIFDFDSSNFIYRFARGETDYLVGAINFDDYLSEYKTRGVGVIEQTLNLSQADKQDIFDALVINSLPQNRIYRYNYFYDNCSTRPRDIIEKNISGTIFYSPIEKKQTYRDLVHECVNSQPWVRFGIDLVIGADADKDITNKQKDFLPLYLMEAYSHAQVKNENGTIKDLVSKQEYLLNSQTNNSKKIVDYPLISGIIVLVISIAISFFSYKKGYILLGKVFDTILFLVAGLAGCVIFFLMYFSIHPCTNPNWNIVWLNPVQLIFTFLFLIKPMTKYVSYYHFINFVLLTMFLLAWFLIPQYLELAFLPFILSLWIRSGIDVLQYRKTISNCLTD